MVVRERLINDVTILQLIGKITIGGGDELLRSWVDRALAAGCRKLIVDMAGVPYIDSSGNGEMVRTFTVWKHSGGSLVFLRPTKRIVDLWSVTKLATVFDVYDDEIEALASFGAVTRTSICPVCQLHAGFGSQQESHHTCANCQSELVLKRLTDESGTAWVADEVTMPTYDGEAIVLRSEWPFVITIRGRLDLFTAEALQEVWRAVPRPRKIIVEIGPACRLRTAKGLAALAALCAPESDGGRTAVWVDPAIETDDLLRIAPPFFDDRSSAVKSLEPLGPNQRSLRVEVRGC
jgi:anti-sigma B factor antagonist